MDATGACVRLKATTVVRAVADCVRMVPVGRGGEGEREKHGEKKESEQHFGSWAVVGWRVRWRVGYGSGLADGSWSVAVESGWGRQGGEG